MITHHFAAHTRRLSLLVGLLVLGCGYAQAGIAWTNASGSNAAFGWSNGENNTNHFGSPDIDATGFYFVHPNSFRAEKGGVVGVTDFARTLIEVAGATNAGAPPIHAITVEEWGTWSAAVSSPSDFRLQADMNIYRYLPDPSGSTLSLTLPVVFNPQDGTWFATRTLTAGEVNNPPYSDADWTSFLVTVTNTLIVKSTAPAGSFIEKSGMRIIIPEPSSLFLLVGGMLIIALPYRRHF